MKKTNQKIFSRLTAFMLAIISSFGFFAKAEKPPFPRGSYRIFNVAVVGSDIVGEKAVEESPGFNKNVMENLCNVGTKLENFAEAEILDDNKISLAEHEFPRTSMILPERNTIFCFYDVANVYTNPDVIKECPFALCPYTLNLAESYDAWRTHMIRLRDFVKTRNEMCDLRFLGISAERTEEISNYFIATGGIACGLDTYNYRQTVEYFGIFIPTLREDCQNLIKSLITWSGDRESLLMKYRGKSFPEIQGYPGMRPEFFHQEGDENSVAMPPIAPKLQPAQPTAPKIPVPTQPIAPKSEASEESKKKSKQIRSSGNNSSIACGMYRNYFLPCEEAPLMLRESFEKMLKILLDENLSSNEIIDGLKGIKFDASSLCLQARIEDYWGITSMPGKEYFTVEEAYTDIFVNNLSIRKTFEILFKNLLDMGYTPNQIINALCNLEVSPPKRRLINGHLYRVVKSEKII